jgi:hypothetical protein
MVDTLEPEERGSFAVALIAGAVIVALIVGGVALVARLTRHNGPAAAQHLPFGPAEQGAAQRIHFLEPQMARASNFLNQEVTYIAGTISNDGTAAIGDVEATFEFRDPFNQVILRETRRLFDANAGPLPGGRRRDFQISIEYIPVEWNQQYPQIRVIGLQLR